MTQKKSEAFKKLILNLEDQIKYQENKSTETIQAKGTRKQLLEFYQNQLKEHLQYPH